MKKLLSIMFAIILICSMVILTSCGEDDVDTDNSLSSATSSSATTSSSSSTSSSASSSSLGYNLEARKTEVKTMLNQYRTSPDMATGHLTDETTTALDRAFSDICNQIDALTAIDDVNATAETYKAMYKAAFNTANVDENKISAIVTAYKTQLDSYAATMEIIGNYSSDKEAEFNAVVNAAKNALNDDELTSKAALDTVLNQGKTAIKEKADSIKTSAPVLSQADIDNAIASIDAETAKYGVNGYNNDGTEAPGKTYEHDLTGMLEEDRDSLMQMAENAKVEIRAAKTKDRLDEIVSDAISDALSFYNANKNSIADYVTTAREKLTKYLNGETLCYENDVYDSKIHADRIYSDHSIDEVALIMNTASFDGLTSKTEIDDKVQTVKNAMYAQYLKIAKAYTQLS
ncbi:MAG: hypothetical protein SOZ62_06740 [Eubacteriales bacterium]|nr:hypothetical protein [Eubacteriales bacterium]